jgi:hypothetical protein
MTFPTSLSIHLIGKNGTSLNIISSARTHCDWNLSQNWIRRSVSWNSCTKCYVVRMKFLTCIFWCAHVSWGYNLTCKVPRRSAWTYLWSWQVQLYCFCHQLKFLGLSIPGFPKSGMNSTNRLRFVIRWDDDCELLQLSLCKGHRPSNGRFSPSPECYYTWKKIIFFHVRLDLWDTLGINPSPKAVLSKATFTLRGWK